MNNNDEFKPILRKNPLFLPQGSVRAIITLIMLGMTAGLFVYEKEIPEWYSMLVVSSVSFYFGTRKATITPDEQRYAMKKDYYGCCRGDTPKAKAQVLQPWECHKQRSGNG